MRPLGAKSDSAPVAESGSRSFLGELIDDPKYGPLPALLLALTVSTGLIDSVSILSLDRVFVANMTGNIVFIGFALAGAPGFSLSASLVALAGFLLGAAIGGRAANRFRRPPRHLAAQCRLRGGAAVVRALVVALVAGSPFSSGSRDVIAALAALALGLQNAAVRRLAVPDVTTTVLTMTLTAIASDIRNGHLRVVLRRVLAVSAMLIGAVIGALLVLDIDPAWALALTCAVVGAVAVMAAWTSRRPAVWHDGR